ncbi:YaaC family protein [Rhodospirillaceae bacterium SYSU D60014]|uniref:YaaC family protein n=1 Tax=Virgifigura deserti TaxID=2268457 RepID=UPI000E66A4DB
MEAVSLRISGKEIPFYKAVLDPAFGIRTVLTNSPWTFVALWLKRRKQSEALFYWGQAQQFYNASSGLPMESAPLLLYYSFMNAAKALLAAKSVPFDPHHGVRAHNMGRAGAKKNLNNEGIKIMPKGVLPSLSLYFQESETECIHSVREILFNLGFVHRTYCLTYTSQAEMFLPIKNCGYVFDPVSKVVFFQAQLSKDVAHIRLANRLPASLIPDPETGRLAIRSSVSIPWSKPSNPTKDELNKLTVLHRSLRMDVQYIAGSQTLWYVKTMTRRPRRLLRYSPTLVLAAMHRLSEICRYRPIELSSYLDGPHTWLLSEFLSMSPKQFLDEIASEITGHQFLVPNVRSPT